MTFFETIFRSNFFIRLRSWEYWPFGIIQLPLFFYFIFLAIRSRSFTFFSASNPGITMGGMFGESKYDILNKISTELIPKTILINAPSTKAAVLNQIVLNGFSFPLIFKPELGERGFLVTRIFSEEDVELYLQKMKYNFLIQELVDLSMEFSVFYARIPSQKNGVVTSLVQKEMLSVTGNGKSSLKDLILKKDRAKLQWHVLQKKFHTTLDDIIPAGETIELVSIGNHCLGTKFLNANHLINDQLSHTFDSISKQIPGFFFGRYDLRCACLQDLYSGKIKIMELNGCGAEPSHIYHPGFSMMKAIGVLFSHWKTIYTIARENNKKGIAYISYKDAKVHYKNFKQRVA